MAKVLLPKESVAVSGKIYGDIFQSWRGLNVIRKFTMPVIRHTVLQMARRANFTTLSKNWGDILTQPMRDSWNAMTIVIKDLWGTDVKATGLNLYQKVNSALLDAGKDILTNAPTTKAMLPPEVSLLNDGTGNLITIPKVSADEVSDFAPFCEVWIAGLSAFISTVSNLTIITTVGVRQSITPGKGLYRRVCSVDENSSTDQTIALRSAPAVDLPAGVKVSAIIVQYTKDGMKSVPIKVEGISVAHTG